MRRRVVSWLLLGAPALAAQTPATRGDTVGLAELQASARRSDPRTAQLELLESQSRLRLRGIALERRPAFTLEGQGQYQSDVTKISIESPVPAPFAPEIPTPPHDTWDASLGIQQPIIDPSLAPRRNVERAQLAESRARVRVSLHARRQEVNDAYFTALLLQTRTEELSAAIADLDAQHQVVAARVRDGAALPGEAAALRAARLRREQDVAAVRADRRAALAVLARLTGRSLDDAVVLRRTDTAAVARARIDSIRARPEYEQFRAARALLATQADAAAARERPRLSAYGRAGYGKPGLNMISDRFDSYWLVGLRVQWTPFTWGAPAREREVLALQARIVRSDEEAFTDAIQRSVERELAAIDRADAALALDDEIIALREGIEREARARLREGVLTAAEYVDRRTDVLEARLARATHATELAQARARLLTTLGLEVP